MLKIKPGLQAIRTIPLLMKPAMKPATESALNDPIRQAPEGWGRAETNGGVPVGIRGVLVGIWWCRLKTARNWAKFNENRR